MLRFSLLTLLGVVLVAAVGSAALANPTDNWRQAAFGLTVVFVVWFSPLLIGANHFHPGWEAVPRFAFGFFWTALFYYILASCFGYRSNRLPTYQVIEWLGRVAHGISPMDMTSPKGKLAHRASNLVFVGHCLWTLILATLGGLFVSCLGRRRDGERARTIE